MGKPVETDGVVTREDHVVPVAGPASSPVAVALVGFAVLAVAMGIGRFAFTPILPMMQADAGLTVADGAWLASANYAGYLLGALSAVVIRMPATVAIRLGLGVITVATLGMGFETPFAVWMVLRAVAGVASAWVLISVSAWALARLTPLRRPALNGTVFAGVGAGIAAAGVVCLVLMNAHAASAQAWIGLGLLGLVITAATWSAFAGHAHLASPHAHGLGGRSDRWTGDHVRLVLCYGAFGFGYIIPATFLPVMARQEIQDPRLFGWAWPVFGLAAAVSTFSAAVASRIGGNRRLWAISQLVMAFGVALPIVVPGLAGIVLAALCVGGTFMVTTLGGMQEAGDAGGPVATRLMAAMTTAFALGQILGPMLVSYAVAAGANFAMPLLVAGGALVLSAGLLLWPPRRLRTRPRRATPAAE